MTKETVDYEAAEKSATLITDAFQQGRWIEVYRLADVLMTYAARSVEADYEEIKQAEGL